MTFILTVQKEFISTTGSAKEKLTDDILKAVWYDV